MRKFLLLLSFLTLFTAVKAQDPVVSITTVKDNQSTNGANYTATGKLTLKDSDPAQSYTTYGFNYYNGNWGNIRCGNKSAANTGYTATITTDFAISAKINKVEVELLRAQTGNNDKLTSLTLSSSVNSDMSEAKDYTIDASGFNSFSKNVSSTFSTAIDDPAANRYYRLSFQMPKTSNNGVVAVVSIKFYGEVDANAVTPPTITLDENDMVNISQADGADIYYTTDGTNPSATSTKYTTPFQLTQITTVKAMAILNGKESEVTSKTLTPTLLGSIADFLSAKPSANSKINAPLTAIYQCGRNLYLTDGTDFILAYNNNNVDAVTNLGASNGDVISFISGTYKDQNGLPELIPSAVGEKTAGTAVEPEELAIEEIGSDMLNKYVRISDVNIEAASSTNNYTATDETGSIVIYNTFNNASYYPNAILLPDGSYGNTIPEGENFTVTGFVSCYGKTIQITPIAITGGTVMETVATPVFEPEAGTDLEVGTQITITCETPDAKIYYTTEADETPSAASILYTAPLTFSEAVTIKAIAVKDGMLDSDIATATYAVKVDGQEKAEFDFGTNGNAASLTDKSIEAGNEGNAGGTNDLKDVLFVNGPISLTFSGTGTDTKWWATGSAPAHVRIYKNNTVTVKVIENGYRIEKVQFVQGSTVKDADFEKLSISTTATNVEDKNGTWNSNTATWTAPSDALVNEVVLSTAADQGTAQFNGISVMYVEDDNSLAGIEEIGTDNENAPVEYFNLQGIRVSGDNLTPGIYVRRQGSTVTKVLVK